MEAENPQDCRKWAEPTRVRETVEAGLVERGQASAFSELRWGGRPSLEPERGSGFDWAEITDGDTGRGVCDRPYWANVKGRTACLMWEAVWARNAGNLQARNLGPRGDRRRADPLDSRLLKVVEGRGFLLKKKKKGCACVRLAALANEKRGRAEPVQEAASRDRALRGGACVPESG